MLEEVPAVSYLLTIASVQCVFGLFSVFMGLIKINFNLHPTPKTIILHIGLLKLKENTYDFQLPYQKVHLW